MALCELLETLHARPTLRRPNSSATPSTRINGAPGTLGLLSADEFDPTRFDAGEVDEALAQSR